MLPTDANSPVDVDGESNEAIKEPLELRSDDAIETPGQDLLGFADHFAPAIARVIKARRKRESFVIALLGPWGSGKTSLKNLVLHDLEQSDNAPYIVQFEPWQYRDRDSMLDGFFLEVLAAITKDGNDEPVAGQIAEQFVSYSSKIGSAVEFTGAVLSLGNPIVGGLLSGAGKTLKGLSETAKGASEKFSAEDTSPRAAKKKLRALMNELKHPVLVVIDDIDRLYAGEMAQVFQLVKANADFPNFTYLLLYQRESVEEGLQHVIAGQGQDYLEKIVQVPINLPMVDEGRMPEILIKEVAGLIKRDKVQLSTAEIEYSNGLIENEIAPYLRNLRTVRRLINALDLTLPLFTQVHGLDVSLGDLIALETLRLAEPTVYELLPRFADLLLGQLLSMRKVREMRQQIGISVTDEDRHDPHAMRWKELLGHVPLERQPQFGILMERVFGNLIDVQRPVSELRISGRPRQVPRFPVNSSQYFTRYFRFAVPSYELRQSVVHDVVEHMADPEWLRTKFFVLATQRHFAELLRRLQDGGISISDEDLVSVFSVLSEILDGTPPIDQGELNAASINALFFIARRIGRKDDSRQRTALLHRCLESTKAVRLPFYFAYHLRLDAQKNGANGIVNTWVMGESDLAETIALALSNVHEAAHEGWLGNVPFPHKCVSDWASFEPQEARAWFLEWAKEQKNFVSFLNIMTATGYEAFHSPNVPGGLMSAIHELATYCSPEDFLKLVEAVDTKDLPEEDSKLVNYYHQSVRLLIERLSAQPQSKEKEEEMLQSDEPVSL